MTNYSIQYISTMEIPLFNFTNHLIQYISRKIPTEYLQIKSIICYQINLGINFNFQSPHCDLRHCLAAAKSRCQNSNLELAQHKIEKSM